MQDDCFECKAEEEGVVGATPTDDNTAIEQSDKPRYQLIKILCTGKRKEKRMERRVILKRCKGLLALVLAFMMLFGTGIHIMAEESMEGVLISATYDSGPDYGNPPYSKPSSSPTVTTTEGTGGHVHDYKWGITLEPTENKDGRYESACDCGHVEAVQPISYFGVIVKRIIKSIEEAPVNGTVRVENAFLRCLTDEIMDALHKRTDVSLEVVFTEEEQNYRFVIPAGKAPTEEEWYGYFYLGSIFGWKE